MEVRSFVLVKFSVFQIWFLTLRSLPVQPQKDVLPDTHLPDEINPNYLISQACYRSCSSRLTEFHILLTKLNYRLEH